MGTYEGFERDYEVEHGIVSIVNNPDVAVESSIMPDGRGRITIGTDFETASPEDASNIAAMPVHDFMGVAYAVAARHEGWWAKDHLERESVERDHATFMAGVVRRGTRYFLEPREANTIFGYVEARDRFRTTPQSVSRQLGNIVQGAKFGPTPAGIRAAMDATGPDGFWEEKVDWTRQGGDVADRIAAVEAQYLASSVSA